MADGPELVGAVHVHTGHSDGSGTVAEVAAAAETLGLDFVVIADHDRLSARESGAEGHHGNVLIAAGAEISTKRNMTHLLALGHSWTAARFAYTVDEALRRTHDDGGKGLLAHAQGRGLGGRGRDRRDWPWWDHPQLAGAEIWSYLQDWGGSFRLLRPASYSLENVPRWIGGPPEWLLSHWDEQAEKRPFAGIGASDNHAKRLWPFRRQYWPHVQMLGRLVNRVRLKGPLSDDGAEAARQVMAVLGEGRCAFAREELASSEGFAFFAMRSAECGMRNEAVAHSGDSIAFESAIKLVVESPVEAELRICRLGSVVASGSGKRLEFEPAEAGAYRAEARLPWSSAPEHLLPDAAHRPPSDRGRHPALPWCFSNHVRLEA
ncbi:MAG: hypothetical protein ACYTGB_11575 [Planctomycetota bacterium]|jgi:hypothetical protein